MATYTVNTMFLVTGLNDEGNEVGASGFEKDQALSRFYAQYGTDFKNVITILEITSDGKEFSKSYIYPDLPHLSFLNEPDEMQCDCVKTSCEKCNIELPSLITDDYSAQGFYIPNDFEYADELREAPDTALIEEQLSYISANSTNAFRQQLLKEGLR
jgi:hypothetical protein